MQVCCLQGLRHSRSTSHQQCQACVCRLLPPTGHTTMTALARRDGPSCCLLSLLRMLSCISLITTLARSPTSPSLPPSAWAHRLVVNRNVVPVTLLEAVEHLRKAVCSTECCSLSCRCPSWFSSACCDVSPARDYSRHCLQAV